jgi:hypothetical protein
MLLLLLCRSIITARGTNLLGDSKRAIWASNRGACERASRASESTVGANEHAGGASEIAAVGVKRATGERASGASESAVSASEIGGANKIAGASDVPLALMIAIIVSNNNDVEPCPCTRGLRLSAEVEAVGLDES